MPVNKELYLMTALPWNSRPARYALGAGLALSSLLSCEPSNKVKSGPPALVLFAPIDGGGNALGGPDDQGMIQPVPATSRIAAVFDRLLDPTTLEDVDAGTTSGKTDVLIVQAAAGTVGPVSIVYTPNGDADGLIFSPAVFGVQKGPNIIASVTPTLPSGTQITATLSKTKVRSKAGEGFVVAQVDGAAATTETLMFKTEALAVAFTPAPDADAGATCGAVLPAGDGSALTLKFNNLLATSTATAPAPDDVLSHVTVTGVDATGAALAAGTLVFTTKTDGSDTGLATTVTLEPGAAGWPLGATLTVNVDDKAQDVAGGLPLGTAASGCFTVAAPSDGGNP